MGEKGITSTSVVLQMGLKLISSFFVTMHGFKKHKKEKQPKKKKSLFQFSCHQNLFDVSFRLSPELKNSIIPTAQRAACFAFSRRKHGRLAVAPR